MGLTTQAQVGKKHTIYLPKDIVKISGIKIGMKILISVVDGKIIIEPIADPIELALEGEKFAEITPEEIEATSIEEQSKYTKSSS
jgi:bifunctional DNA-binding transcriptional regulator/antitoxin component of YhaV-PrlF toxin-antitoxin module